MPTVQSNYPDTIRNAVAGQIANQEPNVLISRNVEESDGIGFGIGVVQGTEDKGCVISDGSALLGVTVRDRSVTPESPNEFAEGRSARIMTKGVIWVLNSGGVAAGDPVDVLNNGVFANTGGTTITNARWETTAATGELAQLRLGALSAEGGS